MAWLQIIRLAVFAFSIVCGIIVLAMSAHITSESIKYFDVYYNFAVLGVVSGGLAMITLPIMLVIDFLRSRAFTSLVVVELSWLSILWVFFLATGALTADQTGEVFASCDYINTIINQVCHETQAIEAFSFLAWIVLMAYTILLLTVALINSSRGSPTWTSTVREKGGLAPAPPSAGAGTSLPGPQTTQYQQQPLMAPSPAPAPYQAQPIYGQPTHGAQPHVNPLNQYPPQPTASPASVPPSHSSYPQV